MLTMLYPYCRPPRGGRGLKLPQMGGERNRLESPPSRGAWIEISSFPPFVLLPVRRPPRGGRGLKFGVIVNDGGIARTSPPSRGAWIEISTYSQNMAFVASPPSRGAWIEIHKAVTIAVSHCPGRPPRGGRGLKFRSPPAVLRDPESPPSRGAWIEIAFHHPQNAPLLVAPLAGGVD